MHDGAPRDRERGDPWHLITIDEVIGHAAAWAVRQHPYHEPPHLFEITGILLDAARTWHTTLLGLSMQWFPSWYHLQTWMSETLAAPRAREILVEWNTARDGSTNDPVIVDSYSATPSQSDIIDIDAWMTNVARQAWQEAKTNEVPRPLHRTE